MEAYLLDWASLLLRWLHLVAGVAWIGASFYFVMLDNSLKPPARPEDAGRGASGELWAVHGGGFYCSQKFPGGPRGEPLAEDLHWSKWEAYTTWLSGMGLLAVVYWVGAKVYLIDPQRWPLTPTAAVGLSVAALVLGWVVYDFLCRRLAGRDRLLAAMVFAFVVLCTWGLSQIFAARGASILVGAMLGTLMAANVFFHIIPGQKRMVAQIRGGQAVDPRPGLIGKQRSVHNTYFTLPVLFVMIGNHYPVTYARPRAWLVLVAIMLAGVLIRQFFVLRHRGRWLWWLPMGGAAVLGLLILLLAPPPVTTDGPRVSFAAVRQVIERRCVACHAARPTEPGFAQAPKGVSLETPEEIGRHAAKIAETVASGYMPLANLTGMTAEERRLIAAWHAQGGRLTD